MPNFICRFTSDDGKVVSRSFFIPTAAECRRHYEEQGFCVLSVRRDWKNIHIPLLPFEKKIKDKDFLMFNQELVALVKAGYPILKSITIISSRVKNIHLKELLMQVEKEIKGGKSLSEAFLPFKREFSKVYIASLMAGERSGNLADSITKYIDYAKVISETKAKIKSALTYPTVLIIFSMFLMGILINFILPRFAEFYSSFQARLPAITRVLVSFAVFAKRNVLVFLTLVLFLLFLYLRMKRKEKGEIFIDRMKLKIPYARLIWLESAVSLFSRTLGLMLGGGISLIDSIGIASQAVPNKFLFQKMKNLPDHIKNGESLYQSLHQTGFFPALALDMVRIGESSANLDGMLIDVAEVYNHQIQMKIDRFVSLIEPVIIIVMGLLVAGMLLSVYLPIFNIIRVIG
ncbi:MAG: type II secretion system F family protein [Candidatus Aminicenantes bacterium]|nr:type II secretion system F family protein [Candidatus Aminicenantes bacterium]